MTAIAPDLTAVPAPAEATGTPFTVFLVPEGVESLDGRMLEPMTSELADGPRPLMMQETSTHGPGQVPAPSWYAGTIEEMYRDPSDATRLMGRGHLMANEDGARAESLIRGGLRTVSIDGYSSLPPAEQVTAVDAEGQPVLVLKRYSGTVIGGATVVPHPAFQAACIWLDDEPVPPQVAETHGAVIPADAPPEVLDLGALVAAGGAPLNPPKAWFERVPAPEYHPLVTTAEGAIYGYVARRGTCHIGSESCETAPYSATDYAYFHTDGADTAEGVRVPCGVLTMGTSHQRNLRASVAETLDHYDHTGTVVAKIRATDTPVGIWVCGAVRPGLTEDQLWMLQGAKGSGDWRDVTDQRRTYRRELVALLCVNVPGFPVPRPEALVASGQIVAQIGELGCETCAGEAELARAGHPSAGNGSHTAELEDEVARLTARVGELEALVRPQLLASATARITAGARTREERIAAVRERITAALS